MLTVLPCFAQSDYFDSSTLPNKLGIHHIEPLLEMINSGDTKRTESFIKQNFAPEFRDMFPLSNHVDVMLDMHRQYGQLSFHSIRNYVEPLPTTELVAIVKSAKTEGWQAITIYVTPEKPHKINGLRFSPARRPNNLPQAGTLTLEQAVEELDSYVKRMAKQDVFSGTVLLAKDGKVLYQTAQGKASKRFNVDNNLQTKFNLGSMNKMFTAIGIMQLVEAGKLSLNDKLSMFIDDSWLAKDIADKIEMRHLLTHSSGLGSYFNQTYMQTSKNNYRQLADYKPLIKDETLRFEPGTDNRYSNTGMFLLGVVIENVSGQDYFSYIREHIYVAAGMKNSDSYEMDQPITNLAIGYEPSHENKTGWRNNLFTHVLKGGPAGGGFSTVEDLHQFAQALTQFKLLGKDFTRQLYLAKDELHAPNYGFGFAVGGTQDNRIVGHGGGFEGISANLDIYLDKGYVSAVLSNYGSGSRPIENKIRELLTLVE